VPEVNRTAFELEPRPGEVLRGDLWVPTPPFDSPDRAIVVCHGFKGFKDWGFFPHVGRHLAERLGCLTVTFNFTGSGVGADLENFTEPEAFARNTFSNELADLSAVLVGLEVGELGEVEHEPVARIGVLGHSRGGVAAILSGELPAVRATPPCSTSGRRANRSW
jgi:pimeloyl-ACP methyl ester carboxylesterase